MVSVSHVDVGRILNNGNNIGVGNIMPMAVRGSTVATAVLVLGLLSIGHVNVARLLDQGENISKNNRVVVVVMIALRVGSVLQIAADGCTEEIIFAALILRLLGVGGVDVSGVLDFAHNVPVDHITVGMVACNMSKAAPAMLLRREPIGALKIGCRDVRSDVELAAKNLVAAPRGARAGSLSTATMLILFLVGVGNVDIRKFNLRAGFNVDKTVARMVVVMWEDAVGAGGTGNSWSPRLARSDCTNVAADGDEDESSKVGNGQRTHDC